MTSCFPNDDDVTNSKCLKRIIWELQLLINCTKFVRNRYFSILFRPMFKPNLVRINLLLKFNFSTGDISNKPFQLNENKQIYQLTCRTFQRSFPSLNVADLFLNSIAGPQNPTANQKPRNHEKRLSDLELMGSCLLWSENKCFCQLWLQILFVIIIMLYSTKF